jgi:hypothetical protein
MEREAQNILESSDFLRTASKTELIDLLMNRTTLLRVAATSRIQDQAYMAQLKKEVKQLQEEIRKR